MLAKCTKVNGARKKLIEMPVQRLSLSNRTLLLPSQSPSACSRGAFSIESAYPRTAARRGRQRLCNRDAKRSPKPKLAEACAEIPNIVVLRLTGISLGQTSAKTVCYICAPFLEYRTTTYLGTGREERS